MKHRNFIKARAVASATLIAVGTMSLSLGGCRHDEPGSTSPNFTLVDPAQRHPILVSQKPSNLAIHVPRGSSGLTPKSRADVLNFAQHYRVGDAGDSRLVIQAPSGSSNEVAAMHSAQQVRALLTDNGFPESSISIEAYDVSRGSDGPIKVSYMRYVAEAPECGQWPINVAYNPNNLPMTNTGCANQHNLAAMIANPADLIGPRTVTPRSGERRDVVWEKYQKGDSTASAKNEDGRSGK
jgi:pilus assembly protein CpaD